MELACYRIIDCSLQSIISNKVINYLKNNTDFFEPKDFPLWNKVNTIEILKAVPEINTFYQSIGLKIREISFTIINKYNDADLHIDELPVTAKINFPILNTEKTFNEWYEVPKELFDTVDPIVNQFGAKYYNLSTLDLTKCTKIAEVETTQPIVFNSQIPHRIRIAPKAQLPRIVMPCTFFNEPIDLLGK